MKTYFVVTIDTEIDSSDWKPKLLWSLKNIRAIPKLQNLFKKYNVRPTYLITYPIAKDKQSVNMFEEFLKKGEIEIGAHLHPWTTPPFSSEKEKIKLGYPHHSFLELEKLKMLTQTIENSFGKKPCSYRAGRYGFDEESLSFLKKLGYLVDTSISPNLNWSFDKGPNFSDFFETKPYFLNSQDIKKSGESSVLEIPISIIVNRNLPIFFKKIYNNLPFKLKYVFKKTGILKTLWLRPSVSSFEEMKAVCDFLLVEGNSVLNMMFHSNEIIAGTSPYIQTEKDSEEFFNKLAKILDYLINQKKLESKTLSELYNLYS